MRIAVVGGTGLAGNEVVRALQARGDEPVVIARSRGVDLVSGEGLDEALAGVEAVVDASNALGSDARAFFEAATTNLLAAERRAGVRHHVVLSIVGVDRVPDNAHYAGKIRQEELALAGPIPVTIVRATQFHDFGAQVAGWTRDGDTATIPPLLVQPIAVSDLGEILAETAAGPGEGAVIEVAGPGTQDLVDMTRRTLAERGEDLRLVAKWGGAFSVAMAGEALLPGPDARIARTSFEDWLSGSRAAPA